MQMTNSKSQATERRIKLYGVGVIAPGASDLPSFLKNIREQKCTLEKFIPLQGGFLVGSPKLDFRKYQGWISSRHSPSKYSQLLEKGGFNVLGSIGACIDAMEGSPGLESALKELNHRVWIGVATCFGDYNASQAGILSYKRAKKVWSSFWAQPVRNEALRIFLENPLASPFYSSCPPNPVTLEIDSIEREEAFEVWADYWAEKNDLLKSYLAEFSSIEALGIEGDVRTDKLNLIRSKNKAKKLLHEKFGSPPAPWESVDPVSLWNIPNVPASQISMLMGINGPSYGLNAACASFGVALREGTDAIKGGLYDAAIVGCSDVPPGPEVTSAFFSAKVLAAGDDVSIPLTQMRGTHMSGGSVIWVLADSETMKKFNVKDFGVEINGVGLSSDAEHIITPSLEGPKACIREALKISQISPEKIVSWDLHATGTPGDWSELNLIDEFVPKSAWISARKGLFGHAMGAAGGLELTAQLLGPQLENSETLRLPACGIPIDKIHPSIRQLGRNLLAQRDELVKVDSSGMVCGKLSMGIGGISACVIATRELSTREITTSVASYE